MKIRLLNGVHLSRRTGFKYLCLFGITLIFFCAALWAHGAKDLLLMPAMKSDKAPSSIIMDVTRADGRLVAVGEWGHILYSDDNGSTWTQADVPVSVTLTAVNFPTAQKGWAVGHDGVVLHSEDAGQTWQKQLDGGKINDAWVDQLKKMIRIQTEKLKIAEQEQGEEELETMRKDLEELGYVLEGAEEAVKDGPSLPLFDLWFKNDRVGIIIGSFGLIFGTTDGGNTWNPLMDRLKNPEGYHYYGITRSGDDLFIAGELGRLFRSDDLGHTWYRLNSPYIGSFWGIIGSPDGDIVITFGLLGNTFYSYDRGETWIPVEKEGTASLHGGTFLSDGSFCIGGVDGRLHRSADMGKTFKTQPTRFPGIISLTEASDGSLVLVGIRGTTRIKLCSPEK